MFRPTGYVKMVEAASLLRVTPDVLEKLMGQPGFPEAKRLGGAVMFRKADLRVWGINKVTVIPDFIDEVNRS